jgi:hypothetical protein
MNLTKNAERCGFPGYVPYAHSIACFSLTKLHGRSVPKIEIKVNGESRQAIVDTGAGISVLGKSVEGYIKPCQLAVKSVNGMPLSVQGIQNVQLFVAGVTLTHAMLVIDGVYETIIGADLLRRMNARIDFNQNIVSVGKQTTSIIPGGSNGGARVGTVMNKQLPECGSRCIRECVEEFADLFSTSGDDYGLCDWVEHTIELQPGSICKPLNRRVPQKLAPELRKQIDEMLEKGIIRKARSPYASPIVMVRRQMEVTGSVLTFVN